MKSIRWNPEKDCLLRANLGRGGIGFAECAEAIGNGQVLDVVENTSVNHPGQRMFILNLGGYAYCVPFVETDTEIFLKTLFPSRDYTARYLERRQ